MIKKALPLLLTIFSMSAMFQMVHAEEKPVRHIVAFNYKEGATEGQVKQVTEAFSGLQKKIPGIVSFEHGVNNSPEGLNDGFTHVYLLTFENTEARDAYLPHPEHEKFGVLLEKLDILKDVFVVDYSVRN